MDMNGTGTNRRPSRLGPNGRPDTAPLSGAGAAKIMQQSDGVKSRSEKKIAIRRRSGPPMVNERKHRGAAQQLGTAPSPDLLQCGTWRRQVAGVVTYMPAVRATFSSEDRPCRCRK